MWRMGQAPVRSLRDKQVRGQIGGTETEAEIEVVIGTEIERGRETGIETEGGSVTGRETEIDIRIEAEDSSKQF